MFSIEMWMAFQVALEALLVLLMIAFLVKLRRLRRGVEVPDGVEEAMERFISESQRLSAVFTESLEEKKELSVSLLLKLERKITEMNRLLEEADQGLRAASGAAPDPGGSNKANPAAPENRALVIRLADRGHSVEDIARKTRLHRGEVELILDLEKQFKA